MDQTESVIQTLRRIIRAVDLRSRCLVRQCGLTGPQITVMKAIDEKGSLPVSELAQSVHLSQATVTGILDRLSRTGLIARRRSEQDRRKMLASLTARGRDVLEQAPPLLQENFLRGFSALADWEQTRILSSLQRVVAMMEAEDIDATPMLTTGPIDASPEETQAFLEQKPPAAPAACHAASASRSSARQRRRAQPGHPKAGMQ